MGGAKWDPTHELLRLQDRLNRIFGQVGDDDDQLISGQWTPPCDIIETREAVLLRAELPGVREESIDVQVEAGLLTLRGEKRFEKEGEDRSYHRIERAYGSFVRTFTLPRTVDPEAITARYDRGVLELVMPKKAETRPRSIRIEVSD
jgi:HSP20 family protein